MPGVGSLAAPVALPVVAAQLPASVAACGRPAPARRGKRAAVAGLRGARADARSTAADAVPSRA